MWVIFQLATVRIWHVGLSTPRILSDIIGISQEVQVQVLFPRDKKLQKQLVYKIKKGVLQRHKIESFAIN